MHCATTGNLAIDDDDAHPPDAVKRLTIFEHIQDEGRTWKMYYMHSNCDTDWLNETVLCQQFNKNNPAAFNVTQVPIEQFFVDVENGTLPFYSFIMSFNDLCPDTSMHPASNVEPGENMLACIYNALQESKYWTNTLLIVNFDENGGMYDHVGVPPATPPDDPDLISMWQSKNTHKTYSFDFSVLGVRVPVILISPWLKAGVCSTQYQNTSILRFLQDMLPNRRLSDSSYLTHRDLHAPSIAPVFDYEQFGSQEARTDCPSNIKGYGGTDACAQFLAYITPDAAPHTSRR